MVVDIDDNGLVFKKNLRILSEAPDCDEYTLLQGDVIQVVNGCTRLADIKDQLKTAPIIHMAVKGLAIDASVAER